MGAPLGLVYMEFRTFTKPKPASLPSTGWKGQPRRPGLYKGILVMVRMN